MKRGILLVAFGSGTVQGETAFKLFDTKVRGQFPDIPVRWAFTSLLLRERLAKVRKKTDSVAKALQKMWFEKYTHVAVQTLHIISGSEHEDVLADIAAMQQSPQAFAAIAAGQPLLATPDDICTAAQAVVKHVPLERNAGDVVILMGHGARHTAVEQYGKLAEAVRALDPHIYIGTMSGQTTLEHILPKLHTGQKVWLMPLLSVVGRHALDDMAGEAPESWRSRIQAHGCICEPVLKGTAEYASFIDIWLKHLTVAVATIEGDYRV